MKKIKYTKIKQEDIKGDYHFEVLDPGEPLYKFTEKECDHQHWLLIEIWDKNMTKMIGRKLTRCGDCGYKLKTPMDL